MAPKEMTVYVNVIIYLTPLMSSWIPLRNNSPNHGTACADPGNYDPDEIMAGSRARLFPQLTAREALPMAAPEDDLPPLSN